VCTADVIGVIVLKVSRNGNLAVFALMLALFYFRAFLNASSERMWKASEKFMQILAAIQARA
jgi:hypothetical protein